MQQFVEDYIINNETRGTYELPVQGDVPLLGTITPDGFLIQNIEAVERKPMSVG
jgi:hypothetical protein